VIAEPQKVEIALEIEVDTYNAKKAGVWSCDPVRDHGRLVPWQYYISPKKRCSHRDLTFNFLSSLRLICVIPN